MMYISLLLTFCLLFSQIQSFFLKEKELECLTESVAHKPCVFPYKLGNKIINGCTTEYKDDGRLEGWCPTSQNSTTLEGTDWSECLISKYSACSLLQYHSHEDLLLDLELLAQKYPQNAQVFSIGSSNLGANIGGLKLGENIHEERPLLRPMVKLIGNMHGNEPVGRELLLHLCKHLLGSYGRDERVTQLLKSTELWILPTVNPDGFARAREGSCEGGGYREGRLNEGHKDLNRDFPKWNQIHEKNNEEGRQVETLALMTFITSHPFVLSANFHDGAVLVNYPWDDYQGKDFKDWRGIHETPDQDVFYHISKTYTSAHPTMMSPDTCTKWGPFESGITNGAEWYPVIGGMQDFNYLYSNALEITVELSCCKFPPAKFLLREWNQNEESILSYVEQVHIGVKGLVKSDQGEPLKGASIQIKNRDKDVLSSERGEYWKLLLPGNYEIRASSKLANGDIYESEWQKITIRSNSTLRLDLVATKINV